MYPINVGDGRGVGRAIVAKRGLSIISSISIARLRALNVVFELSHQPLI